MRFGFRLAQAQAILKLSFFEIVHLQCTLRHLSLKRCSSVLLNDLLFLLVPILIRKCNIFWLYSVIGNTVQTKYVRNCDVKFRIKQDTFIRKMML